LDVLKRNVDRTASDLESVRAQIKQMKTDTVSKQLKYIHQSSLHFISV